MDYDIAILDSVKRLAGYKIKPTPDGYELDLVAYSGKSEAYSKMPKIILTRGTKWTSKPKMDLQQITYIVSKIKAWEREKDGPIRHE